MSAPTTTRGRIQSAALDLFLELGYDGASMDAIAEASGVSKPAVYYHFGSKQELFLELLSALLEGMASSYIGTLSQAGTLRETIGALIELASEMRDVFGAGRDGGHLGYVPLLVDGARRFPEDVARETDRIYGELVELLAERAEDARATGEARSSLDPQAFGLAMVALVEGSLLVGALAPSCGSTSPQEAVTEAIWLGAASEAARVQR